MPGSELCSRKEHMYRLIELPSRVARGLDILSNWEILSRGGGGGGGGGGGVGVSVLYIFKP